MIHHDEKSDLSIMRTQCALKAAADELVDEYRKEARNDD